MLKQGSNSDGDLVLSTEQTYIHRLRDINKSLYINTSRTHTHKFSTHFVSN